MKALVGLLVAAAVLVLGGLPALALALDDDPTSSPGYRARLRVRA